MKILALEPERHNRMDRSHNSILTANAETAIHNALSQIHEWIRHEMIRQMSRPDEEFNGFLESAPDAVVITDRDGRIIRVNAQTEKLFGYLREELFGQEVEMLMPERFREQHVGQRTDFTATPTTRPMGMSQQMYGLRNARAIMSFPSRLARQVLHDCPDPTESASAWTSQVVWAATKQ
jgi:PAS domain-containing protein